TALSTSTTGTMSSRSCAGSGSQIVGFFPTLGTNTYPSGTQHPTSAVASRDFEPSKNSAICSVLVTSRGWVRRDHSSGAHQASSWTVGQFRYLRFDSAGSAFGDQIRLMS